MKFKTSAIALAVAGTVAAPVAVQAGADELYASARIGIESVDHSGTADMAVRSLGSRFGARGETDLGNGLTGFGRYEWDVDLEPADAQIKKRHSYVGLKGDFGSLTIGQTYHSYYNLVYGPTDNPWWGSGYHYASPGRTADGVTFAGSAGAVAYSATGYFTREAEEDSPDGTEIAVSFGLGDMTLGLGTRDMETFEDPIVGVVLSGIALGDITLGVGFQNQDEDDSFVVEALFGNMYVHFEAASNDAADTDPTAITVGYTQSLGRKTTVYYEGISVDDDATSDDDNTTLRAILKYDII